MPVVSEILASSHVKARSQISSSAAIPPDGIAIARCSALPPESFARHVEGHFVYGFKDRARFLSFQVYPGCRILFLFQISIKNSYLKSPRRTQKATFFVVCLLVVYRVITRGWLCCPRQLLVYGTAAVDFDAMQIFLPQRQRDVRPHVFGIPRVYASKPINQTRKIISSQYVQHLSW